MISTLTIPMGIKILYAIIAITYVLGIPVIRFVHRVMSPNASKSHWLVLAVLYLFSPILVVAFAGIGLGILMNPSKHIESSEESETEEEI